MEEECKHVYDIKRNEYNKVIFSCRECNHYYYPKGDAHYVDLYHENQWKAIKDLNKYLKDDVNKCGKDVNINIIFIASFILGAVVGSGSLFLGFLLNKLN